MKILIVSVAFLLSGCVTMAEKIDSCKIKCEPHDGYLKMVNGKCSCNNGVIVEYKTTNRYPSGSSRDNY